MATESLCEILGVFGTMSPNVSRRDALRLGAGSLAALAGCTSVIQDGGLQSATPETDGGGNSDGDADNDDGSDAVRDVRVMPSVVTLATDSIGTSGGPDEQFVVVSLTAGGDASIDRESVTLTADEAVYEPNDLGTRGGHQGAVWSGSQRTTEPYLGFTVPKPLVADAVVLEWGDDRYALGDAARRRLARPPTTFSVTAFSSPPVVEPASEVDVTLSVANDGDHAGTFVGALNRVGPKVAYTPVRAVHLDLAPGESTTWTHREALDGSAGEAADFRLDWSAGNESTTTRFETERE